MDTKEYQKRMIDLMEKQTEYFSALATSLAEIAGLLAIVAGSPVMGNVPMDIEE